MLVRYLPELLQDNENHVMSDWGSSGRRQKACWARESKGIVLALWWAKRAAKPHVYQ
jgi:hypothetical protein